MIKRTDEIIKFLGRKYINRNEYRKVYRGLFGEDMANNRQLMKKQRQRHTAHGYNIPNRNRKLCVFCIKEGRV